MSTDSVLESDAVLESDSPRRIRPPVFVVGLIAILAVAFLIGRALFFDTGGASSPDEAVQDLAGAISNEDLAGALAALDPHEVSAITDTYQAGVDKAQELGLTGEGGTFGFLDLEVSNLQLDVDQLGPDIAKVTITDGRATAEFHPDRVSPKVEDMGTSILGGARATAPFDEVGEALEGDGTEDWINVAPEADVPDDSDEPANGEVTAADLRTEIDGEQVDPFVIAVRRDGGWYVSPFHTIAEYVLLGADDDVPRPTYTKAELPPAAPTPIAAVERLVDSINARDVDGVIDSVSADEWAVLHTYRAAIVQGVEDALGEVDPDADFKIDDIDLSAKDLDGGRAVVTPKSFTAHVTVPAADADEIDDELSFDDDPSFDDADASGSRFEEESSSGTGAQPETSQPEGPVTYTVEFDGRCVRVDGLEDGTIDSCELAMEPEDGDLSLTSRLGALGAWSGIDGSLDAEQFEDVGIIVVAERDGWAVSPLETLFGALTAGIESITPETFAAITSTQASLPAQAKIAMGQSTDVTINDNGFAVLGVKATEGEPFELTVDDDDAAVGAIVDPDGAHVGTESGPRGTVEPTATGEHRAVIQGKPGSEVTVSMVPYSISTVDLGETFHVELDADHPTEPVRVHVPEAGMISIEGSSGLAISDVDGNGGYGSAIFVDPGDLLIEVSADDEVERISKDVSIVAIEPEALDTTVATDLSLDEGESQLFSFTAPEGRPLIDTGDEFFFTLFEADSHEEVYDTRVEAGTDYLMLVEPIDATGSGTIRFTEVTLDIDGMGTAVDSSWDPAYIDDGDGYSVAIPKGRAATVSVSPVSELDVSLELSCDGEDDASIADAGPAGAAESIPIAETDDDRFCDLYVYGQEQPGDYSVTIAPA